MFSAISLSEIENVLEVITTHFIRSNNDKLWSEGKKETTKRRSRNVLCTIENISRFPESIMWGMPSICHRLDITIDNIQH